MIAPIAWMEWTRARRRPRLFFLNLAIPLILVLPLTLGAAPAFHAAAVYTVLFALFGTMGAAIPLLRDQEAALLNRIGLTGYSARRQLLERVVLGMGLDFIQLLPSLVVILALGAGRAGDWLLAPLVLGLALLFANLVGIWIAAVARSLAEGALFAAVVTLFLLHGSGVFRTPAPEGWGARLEILIPYGPLHSVLLDVSAGMSGTSPNFSAAPAVLTALVLLLITVGLGGPLTRRLTSNGG
ncbi:MAG: ABC transporter permease [Gemmatimonadota bacterium]